MKQDSQRLVLFITLSVGILLGWGYLFPPPKPNPKLVRLSKKQAKKAALKTSAKNKRGTSIKKGSVPTLRAAQATSRPASRPTSNPSKVASKKASKKASKQVGSLPKASSKSLVYKGKLVEASIRAKGGSLQHWKLSAFRDMTISKKKKRVRLDRISKTLRKYLPYSERLMDKRLVKHTFVPYAKAVQEKPNTLLFVGRIPSSRGGFVGIEKRYIFNPDSYQFRVELKLTNRTRHDVRSQVGVRLQDHEDPKKLQSGGMFSSPPEQLRALCRDQGKQKPDAVDYIKLQGQAKEALTKNSALRPMDVKAHKLMAANVGYMALDRRYFIMALIPNWNKGDRGTGCRISAGIFGLFSAEIQNAGTTIESGKSQTLIYKGYLGPKYFNALKVAGSRLETSIDFGFFAFLSKPMLWAMQLLYDLLKKAGIVNWGIAIILLTLLIKLLTWPLTQKSMQSMKKMQRLKPEMDRLKEKYPDDKESQQREMMNLYVKHGINPIAGCLPMVLQMPIWIALYQTILYSVELYQAPFIPGWIEDLSAKDPVYVLPVMLGLAMLVQHKLTPQTMDNAQAKIMGMVMPIFFTGIMLFLPAGLTLYIFVNTILGIAHQWHIYQQPDEVEEPSKKAPTKRSWMQRMQEYAEEQQKQQNQKKKK